MKELVSLFAGVCLLALGLAPAALAQSRDVLKVQLPHAITAAGTAVPAGAYQVSEMDSSSDQPMLLFHSDSFNAIVAVSRTPRVSDDASSRTMLLLRRDGEQLVLQKVQLEGRDYDYDLRVPVRLAAE